MIYFKFTAIESVDSNIDKILHESKCLLFLKQ